MSVALPAPPLLFITDRQSTSVDLRDIVLAALQAGCRWIMVREKDLGTTALTALVSEIVTLARPFDGRVIVNADIEAARATGAAGVHIPSATGVAAARKRLGCGSLIGVSAHTIAEAGAAVTAGADYVTLSPVYLTDSKPGYGPALGLDGLAEACSIVDGPVIALAGISAANASSCIAAGAAGVAVMGGIMRAPDPGAVVQDILRALGAPTGPA